MVEGATAGGIPGGDAAAWQAFRQLSRPERLLAAERMSVEERAAIRAAGVPEEAMGDGRVLPALQRLGGHGPPIEVGHNRRWGAEAPHYVLQVHVGSARSHISVFSV